METQCLGAAEIDRDQKKRVIGVRLLSYIESQGAWRVALLSVALPEEFLRETDLAITGWRYLHDKTKEQLRDLESRLRDLEIDHERDPDD
jgi:hypothetical protein